MAEKNQIQKGTLYIVGTPIGNLSDISQRGIDTLGGVDFIAAEDTRVSVKLLNHFGIKKPLISYFEHNKLDKGEYICQRIMAGESCALISDAGMPAISDPGELLVAQCAKCGIPVMVVPGPSAVISALAVSALPTGRFTFEGFLTMNKKNRKEHLQELVGEKRTMIFYEAPHKLLTTLNDLLSTLGNRKIAVVKELTKLHEQALRTTIEEAVGHFEANPPKGEYVLVINGAEKETPTEYTPEEGAEIARALMETGMAQTQAAKQAAKETGIKKSDIYRLLNM